MHTLTSAVLADALCAHFRDEVAVEDSQSGVTALLPMTDPYGDSLRLHIDRVGDGFHLSDGGFAHHELSAAFATSAPDADIWGRVLAVATHFGVEFDGGELNAEAKSTRELGAVSLALAQAVSDSLALIRGNVPPVTVQFWEEVELFLNDHSVKHETGKRIQGVSGARHKIDFVLRNGSLHVAQAIASELSLRRSLNIFYDVTDKDSTLRPIAFLDDAKEYSSASFQQLAYKAKVFNWAQRDNFMEYWRHQNT